jgi:hypothetical protein
MSVAGCPSLALRHVASPSQIEVLLIALSRQLQSTVTKATDPCRTLTLPGSAQSPTT